MRQYQHADHAPYFVRYEKPTLYARVYVFDNCGMPCRKDYLSDCHLAGMPVGLRLACVLDDLLQSHTPGRLACLHDLLHSLLRLSLALFQAHGLQAPCILCRQLKPCSPP